MFFLGLLSTPLPYLLLAAFYFFGFAMGMFNNSTGDEAIETVSSVTIPVEVKQIATDHSVYYYQVKNHKIQNQTEVLKSDDKTTVFIPDTGTIIFQVRNIKVHEFLFPGFQFSRPPPSGC
jgi:hypothetical protein